MDEAKACRHCGAKDNRPGARFCRSCGKELAPEPVRCPKCGLESPVADAKFCDGCGSPLAATTPAPPPAPPPVEPKVEAPLAQTPPPAEPEVEAVATPPSPPPAEKPPSSAVPPKAEPDVKAAGDKPEGKRKSTGLRVALVLLLLIAASAFPVYWFFIRVPAPELVVSTDPEPDLAIKVEPLASISKEGFILKPGPCTVTLSRKGAAVETVRFTAIPGALHLCVLRGKAVEVSTKSAKMAEHFPMPGALYSCAACARLGTSATCRSCGKPARTVPPSEVLNVRRIEVIAEGAAPEQVLLVANPYSSAVKAAVKQDSVEREFELAAGSVLPISWAPKSGATIRADLDGTSLEQKRIEAPEGISLYTIGGATWYEWLAEDGSRIPEGTIAPGHLVSLKGEEGFRLLGGEPLDPARGKPGKPGLLRKEAAGKPSKRLVPIVSVPLLPSTPRQLGKLTMHPALQASEVALPAQLKGKVIEAIAAGKQGMVVVCEGALYDLASGERLHEEGPAIGSAAFAPDGLFLVTRQAACATIDGKKIVTGPSLTDPTLAAWSPQSGAAVFLHGGQFIRGLFRMAPEGPQEVLPAYPPVTGLGSAGDGVLIARDRRIDRIAAGPGKPFDAAQGKPKLEPVLLLPAGPAIVGVHDAGGTLVFATATGVYMLSDNLVVPLIQGMGGTLHPCKGGVLLHEAGSRRLFLLKAPYFKD